MAIGQFMPMFAAFGGFEPDPFNDYVVMSLDMENMPGGLPDNKSNIPMSFVAGGSPVLDTVNKKFGSASYAFSGTGQYFYQPNIRYTNGYGQTVPPGPLDMASGDDFCVDFWFNMQTPVLSAWNTLVSHKTTSTNNEPQIYINTTASGGKYRLVLNVQNGDRIISGYIIEPGKWHHVSYGRSNGNRWFLYVDGVLIGTYTYSATLSNMSCTIGTSGWQRSSNSTDKFRGNMAAFRWWNGVSPRDGINNFTPPTKPWGPVRTEFNQATLVSGTGTSGSLSLIGFNINSTVPVIGSLNNEPFPANAIETLWINRASGTSGTRAIQLFLAGTGKTYKELIRMNCVTPPITIVGPDPAYTLNLGKFVRQLTGGMQIYIEPPIVTNTTYDNLFVNGQITTIRKT